MSLHFVTGTDTDTGKTLVSAGLLARARAQGLTTRGIKPVASGSVRTAQGLRNRDALWLQRYSAPAVDYSEVNPIALEPAVAPHLAAREAGMTLEASRLIAHIRQLQASPRQFGLVEGAGGWRVPLNRQEDLGEIARVLALPVILVVGLRLGCINHARLSAEAIRADGLRLAGWVGNHIDPEYAETEDTLAMLAHHLDAPCLGHVPWIDAAEEHGPEVAARYLRLPGEAH
ncbi:dethiobiotin synthase [Modicisalibacter sp. 'Wilcox']|uniref:dethiobiotin synthase n=1 Tax=Modicisalibacter sp. 'Wilcox' TaxID=2679914 RepID=UPI0013D440B1|nr:dethiobiotin synthase [Modicisalibacter sp. 'Wilcox']